MIRFYRAIIIKYLTLDSCAISRLRSAVSAIPCFAFADPFFTISRKAEIEFQFSANLKQFRKRPEIKSSLESCLLGLCGVVVNPFLPGRAIWPSDKHRKDDFSGG